MKQPFKLIIWGVGALVLLNSCGAPLADFNYQQAADKPGAFQFTNQSKNAETLEWDFGNGTVSEETNPSYQYQEEGEYTIQLKAKKKKKESVKTLSVKVEAPFAVDFSIEGDTLAGSKLKFTNQSVEGNYQWDFGDDNNSDNTNPQHHYRSSGTYEVVLAVEKDGQIWKKTKSLEIGSPKVCLVEIETPYGNILVQLSDSTPKHQDNFIKLVEEGAYDSLLFHRVIDGFMIQGGDPDSKNAKRGQPLGSGSLGYQIDPEFVDELVHVKGALAAARTNNPQKRSSASQFYLVHGRPITDAMLNQIEAQKGFRYTKAQRDKYKEVGGAPFLDRDYTVYGQVVDGLDVIDKIAKVRKDSRDRPLEDVRMKMFLIR